MNIEFSSNLNSLIYVKGKKVMKGKIIVFLIKLKLAIFKRAKQRENYELRI